ncbi:MAG: glycosyltransferase family 4 protein [Verrucomicrobiaceae bacterium]|nr:glycosyltransferase family 4 protein [Verrucomicrobiaceae bacterium]
MKIGLIYHQYKPAGGLEKYLIEFTRKLRLAGHELHVLTSEVAGNVRQSLDVTWHEVPKPQGLPMLRLWHFNKVAAREAERLLVDVTVGFGRTTTHDLHRAGGGSHAMYSRLLPWYKRYSPKNLLELKLEKDLYQRGGTNAFVFNSARVMAQISGLYPASLEKGHVIYTPVDSETFKPSTDRRKHREQICQQLNTDPWRPIGLFVSLSHRRKGLETLLQAWRNLDATLWIVGKPLGQEWQAKIDEFGLSNRVRALPVRDDLPALYQAADWFVHPTLYDACANTVLQSMCAGLPGIISTQDGAIDHIKDGENGFLLRNARDANTLHEVLKKAFDVDEDRRLEMGLRARETMLPLTWEAHLEGWKPLLESRGR